MVFPHYQYENVNYTTLRKLKRHPYLNTLAQSLCVTHTKNVLKNELCKHIVTACSISKPSDRCYNETDPVTLDHIDDIRKTHLIEWNQYGHHFGCDIRSLVTLFEAKQFMLPWSIDFESGLHATKDIVNYDTQFNMTRVEGLQKALDSFVDSQIDQSVLLPEQSTCCSLSSNHNWFLFEIEKLMDNYGYTYGHIINKILLNDNICDIYDGIYTSMWKIYMSLSTENNIYADVFYQYMLLLYSINAFHITDKGDHLRYIIQICQQYKYITDTNAIPIIYLLFMDM